MNGQNAISNGTDQLELMGDTRRVSEAEKWGYADGGHFPMVLFGLVSSLLLIAGLCRFAVTEAVLFVGIPFVLINGTYLLLSYSVMFAGKRFDRRAHELRVAQLRERTSQTRDIEIDVFLPVCGEPIEMLLETWRGVQQLNWPGTIHVYVLDDSPNDERRPFAKEYGFHYLRREGREFRKAGNLRNAFSKSHSPFILLLDADFRPSPEIIEELIPDLLVDETVALVQSPQYFDVHHRMSWVQAGAGFVQELFYRLIQPARDRFGAGVCVGSCCLYRRSALEELGGSPEIDHSEDLWTGFELLSRGWRLKYLPVVLAKGICPEDVRTFFSQQYRWCLGSLTLVLSLAFWKARLTLAQRFCYLAGFAYYAATAMNSLLALMPPLVMATFYPYWLHWNHLAFTALALIYTPFVLCLWSRYPFGVHFLTTREVSGAAHLQAIFDTLCGRVQEWVVSGAPGQSRKTSRFPWALGINLAASLLGGMLIWGASWQHIVQHPQRAIHFVPLLLLSTLHVVICLRSLEGLSLTFGTASFRNQDSSPARTRHLSRQTIFVSAAGLWILVSAIAMTRGALSMPVASAAPQPMGLIPLSPENDSTLWGGHFSTDPRADFSSYVVEDAFPGANLRRITRLRPHPRKSDVYFASDFTGKILKIERDGSQWSARTVVDMTDSDLRFLYSFAVHPNFPNDPRLFLIYRTRDDDRPMTMRLTSLALPAVGIADFRNEQLLIEQQVENEEHLGGDLAFDRHGCLLISMGDNQLSNRDRQSQRIDHKLFSGILRIDVDQRGGDFSHPPPRKPKEALTDNYFIPNDNPFVGQPQALEEFWAIGLRNPFRISYNHQRDELWIGDVGQDSLEQVEVARAGTNHQWSFREGTSPFRKSYLYGTPPDPLLGISTDPVHEYPHEDLNTCVIGGEIYRGSRFPQLTGRYIYGDNRSGRVWTIDPDNPEPRVHLLQLPFGKAASTLVSISTDAAGEIFFTNFVSVPSVYRVTPSTQMNFPGLLSQTNLFQDLSSLTPAAGVILYDVTVPLWSDGLEKRRWIRLPPGTSIQTNEDAWRFPAGTLLIKHFQQGTGEEFQRPGDPVETRVLVVRENGTVAGATYLWNDDATDATLQLDRAELGLFTDTERAYLLPGHLDCRYCHHRERPVLGFTAEQLNRIVLHNQQLVTQLEWLREQGVFEASSVADILQESKRLVPLDDESESAEQRSRSYLHANCSYCHHTNGIEAVKMSLNLFVEDENSDLVGTPAKFHYHQIDRDFAGQLISPGRPENSAIYRRLKTTDRRYSMPYLGRTRPDEAALKVLEEWILSLDRNGFDDDPYDVTLSREN